MKILVANPNSWEAITDMAVQSASLTKHSDTVLIPVTNHRGTKGIDCCFAEYQSAWSFISDVLRAVDQSEPDATVLAGFGNVGLFALKEALNIPVVSMSESSLALACTLGHRYAVLTMQKNLIPYMEDMIASFGFEKKCLSVNSIESDFESCVNNREHVLSLLSAEIQKNKLKDCEVIVLGCGALCGYGQDLEKAVGIPVLEPAQIAVKTAEMMVEAGIKHSKRMKYAYPPKALRSYL